MRVVLTCTWKISDDLGTVSGSFGFTEIFLTATKGPGVPLPWCPLPDSVTEFSPHFSFPLLNQICVYSPICFPCHAVCHLCGIWVLHTCQIVLLLGEGSVAGEFASPHSNGHVWLMGPLSGASCIFRAAPLSPAWLRQQIWKGTVNMPCSPWDASWSKNQLPGINCSSAAL